MINWANYYTQNQPVNNMKNVQSKILSTFIPPTKISLSSNFLSIMIIKTLYTQWIPTYKKYK